MTHARSTKAGAARRDGFTLLELLVVMGIMLTLSSILVAAYFGMTRAASYTAAETAVYNLLQLARQRACMDGTTIYFMLVDNTSCVLVHGVGEMTSPVEAVTGGRRRFYDAYADHKQITKDDSGLRIWNMASGDYADNVRMLRPASGQAVSLYPGAPDPKYVREVIQIDGVFHDAGKWKYDAATQRGERYGFELYPRQVLPKGFYFDLGSEKSLTIVFKADGTAGRPEIDGNVDNEDTTVTIYEKIATGDKGKIKIRVLSNGTIKPDDRMESNTG